MNSILEGAPMQSTMKAYVYRRYGGPEVVQLEDVAKPMAKDNEILVKIYATTVSSADWRVRTLVVPKGFGLFARLAIGIKGPRQPIMGTELAGVVEAVGKNVTRYKPGDAVFAYPGGKMGCHAEYAVVAENGPVARKPEGLTFEEAASLCFGGSTALHFLRTANVKPGDKVLVIGASGAVGSALVQLAKHAGAEVTGVASTKNLDLVKSLGADKVIDYTREDFTTLPQTYDIIADSVGATTFARSKGALKGGGRYLAIAGGVPDLLAALRTSLMGDKRVIAGPADERAADVQELAELAVSGALRAVVDRAYDFGQIADAHAYVESGRKRGSVVVRVRREG